MLFARLADWHSERSRGHTELCSALLPGTWLGEGQASWQEALIKAVLREGCSGGALPALLPPLLRALGPRPERVGRGCRRLDLCLRLEQEAGGPTGKDRVSPMRSLHLALWVLGACGV